MKLTELQVRKARAENGKPLKLADGHGLILFVSPAGTRSWRYRYEVDGREKLLTLGTYPAMGLAEARAARNQARETLKSGRDPAVVQAVTRLVARQATEQTFEAVARDWHARNAPAWVERHAADVLHSLERDVFPVIGSVPIRDLGPPEILAVLRAIEARGSPETARRIRQRISGVFVAAIGAGLAEQDPAAVVAGAMGPVRQRRQPAVTDLDAARTMLRRVEAAPGHPATRLAMRLLALVALRPGALITTPWAEVAGLLEAVDPVWTVPAARMKLRLAHKDDEARDHLMPLAAQAIDVLRAAKVLSGRSLYVFPNARHSHRPMSENALGYALHRAGYHGQHVPHGWRSTFSTAMNERYPADRQVIDLMLAHMPSGGVEAAYNRALHLQRRRELAQLWADMLLEGFPPAADLLQGPRR